jgi:hypothetical protein
MTNILDIDSFLAGLTGKTCWRVRATLGDQLAIDIGGRRSLKSRKTTEYGEWYIGSLISEWSATRLTDSRRIASSIDPIKSSVAALKILEQTRIQSAKLSDPMSLTVRFDNGVELEFRPPTDVRERDMEYWEVSGPGHLYLSAGPGSRCGVRRSDVPLRDLDP